MDDTPVLLLLHHRYCRLVAPERGREVTIHCLVQGFGGVLQERQNDPATGVVDQYVEPAKSRNCGLNQCFGVVFIGQIAVVRGYALLVVKASGSLSDNGFVKIGDHNVGTGIVERLGNRVANISRGAGNNGCATFKVIPGILCVNGAH